MANRAYNRARYTSVQPGTYLDTPKKSCLSLKDLFSSIVGGKGGNGNGNGGIYNPPANAGNSCCDSTCNPKQLPSSATGITPIGTHFGSGPTSGQDFYKQSYPARAGRINPAGCAVPNAIPNVQFIPINGPTKNKLITLQSPVDTIIIQSNAGDGDIAAWIHFQPAASDQDIDDLDSLFFPGFFMGTGAVYTLNAAGAIIEHSYSQKYRAPTIKFRIPVQQFYLTGWQENAMTGVISDLQCTIIASSDLDDAWLPLIGGI